jgi:hypothetical protein
MKKGDKLTTVSPLGIVHIKKYSDYTLMNMRKDELVRYIRMIESNYEGLNIQYENAVSANFEKFADFEKVIRCKDCVKKQLCSIFRDAKQELGFCAWAVRKDNG